MVISKAQKQSKKNFTFVFLAAIVITRLLIFLIPRTSVIYRDKFHHIYIGLILLVAYFFIKDHKYSDYFLAIVLGLIADQIASTPFYITDLLGSPLAPHSFWHYWSPYSLISTAVIVVISIILIHKYKR
jgi:dolichol kinase